MAFSILHTFIIIAIHQHAKEREQNKYSPTPLTGFSLDCNCTSIIANVCMNYACDLSTERLSCFAGESVVTLENGLLKPMKDLQIGDKVLVNGKQLFEPVSGFIHANKNGIYSFLALDIQSINSNRTSTLLVSPNHLIFDYNEQKARFAGEFRVNDRVQFIDDGAMVPGRILAIHETHEQGFFAPLTPSGTIVVDGVVSSNYATVSNHDLAHQMMKIYQWWVNLMGGKSNSDENIPWLLEGLLNLVRMIPKSMSRTLMDNRFYESASHTM